MRSDVSPEQLLRMSENVSPGLPASGQHPRMVLGSVHVTGEVGLRCYDATSLTLHPSRILSTFMPRVRAQVLCVLQCSQLPSKLRARNAGEVMLIAVATCAPRTVYALKSLMHGA